MGIDPSLTGSDMDLEDTARIDRRKTILAQIEAALLADKLSLEAASSQATGTDPYNTGVQKGIASPSVWKDKRTR
jgi:hypothetical protein